MYKIVTIRGYFQTFKAFQCERWTLSKEHRSVCTVQNSQKPKHLQIDTYLKYFLLWFQYFKVKGIVVSD